MTDQEKIENAASELGQWIQCAVGDMAAGQTGTYDLKTDILADEMYNDVGTLADMLGDRIHDEGAQITGNKADPETQKITKYCIAEELKKGAHTAMIQALENLQKNWK